MFNCDCDVSTIYLWWIMFHNMFQLSWGDSQTLSLLLHFLFGSHMAKKQILKKPSAKKQFTAGRTKPATKLSKKPATKLSKLLQDAGEAIGPRPPLKKGDDSPPLKQWSSYRTYTDAVAIAMDVNGVPSRQRHDGIFTCEVCFSKVSATPTTIVILKQIASMSATPMSSSSNVFGDEDSIRPSPDLPTIDSCSVTSEMGYKSKWAMANECAAFVLNGLKNIAPLRFPIHPIYVYHCWVDCCVACSIL